MFFFLHFFLEKISDFAHPNRQFGAKFQSCKKDSCTLVLFIEYHLRLSFAPSLPPKKTRRGQATTSLKVEPHLLCFVGWEKDPKISVMSMTSSTLRFQLLETLVLVGHFMFSSSRCSASTFWGDLDGPMIQRFIGFVGRYCQSKRPAGTFGFRQLNEKRWLTEGNLLGDLYTVGGMTSGLATTLRIQSQLSWFGTHFLLKLLTVEGKTILESFWMWMNWLLDDAYILLEAMKNLSIGEGLSQKSN